MKSHEVLRDALEKTGAKQIADETDVSLSTVYKWAEPADGTGSGAVNPLDRIEALIRSTGDKRIAQWVCEQAGGFYVNNPTGERARMVLPAASEIMQEFADMLSVIAQAALDNVITKNETAGIRRRWEELKSVSEGVVRSCEEGDFGAAREILSGKKFPHIGKIATGRFQRLEPRRKPRARRFHPVKKERSGRKLRHEETSVRCCSRPAARLRCRAG